jgi:two-component system OmpR family response regulator
MLAPVRLLVVEDDVALAQALRKGFGGQGFATDMAESAERAWQCLHDHAYDCIVLDLALPDADGLTVLAALRERADPTPVLILTARGAVDDRVTGLNAGADDYVQKPFAFPELVARVRALLRRGTPLVGTVLRVEDLEVDPTRMEVRRGGVPISVTAKEFGILEYLVRHAGELVTRTMLLDECWDRSYDGLSNLVDVYISRLRRKIDAGGGPPLLHTVRGAGFVLGVRGR